MFYDKKHEVLFFYVGFTIFAIVCFFLLCGNVLQDYGNGYERLREKISYTRREQYDITTELGNVATEIDNVIEENKRVADKFEENRIVISECREIIKRVRNTGKEN